MTNLLRDGESIVRAASVVVGFDGFVDEMVVAVRDRASLHDYTAVSSIREFSELVGAAAGRSSCREILIRDTAAGGCAVNLGDGLAGLGVQVDCFATLGEPMHAAFRGVAQRFRTCQSWGAEPGRTIAFEFSDGKLMYPAVAQLASFTADHLRAKLADGRYAQACAQARAIAFTNWSLYPHMTECWNVVQREVLASLTQRPVIFIDLVDPSARSHADIRAMCRALGGFAACSQTVLGINRNEAGVLCAALGLDIPNQDDLSALAERLRQAIGLHRVVLHTHHAAVEASAAANGSGSEAQSARASSFHTAQPKRSVGAGDRFNAGYIAACLLSLPAEQRLRFACAVAGAFVRQGVSPTFAEAMALFDSARQ